VPVNWATEEAEKLAEDSLEAQEETQDELITRLDTQYRALIEKYEDLLELFNQTRRENQSIHRTPGYQQVSLHEELSSSDYRVEVLDMLDISHDVSLNISYDGCKENNDKLLATYNHADLLHCKEIEHVNSEKIIEKTAPETPENKNEHNEQNIQEENFSVNVKDSYEMGDLDNEAQVLMNQNNKDASNTYAAHTYCEQNFPRETCEIMNEIVDGKQIITNVSKEEQETNNDEEDIDDDRANAYITDNAGRIHLQNLDSIEYNIPLTDKFISNSCNEKFYNFSSAEHASISSGFSEEVLEAAKADQECQTDIAMPEKYMKKTECESYQTIFCQLFALLKQEKCSI